jgi:hypothetical protein
MAYDSAANRAESADRFNPMQIARHDAFTAREKLDLLQQVKTEASGSDEKALGFSRDEIDEAIEKVKLDVQRGSTAFRGDN